jgi:hypothetical protein
MTFFFYLPTVETKNTTTTAVNKNENYELDHAE